MMELVKRILRHSLMRYLVVGGSCFALTVVLTNAYIVFFGWDRGVAQAAGFLSTFLVTYTLQRVFTFRSEADNKGALVRYLILVGVNTLVQAPIAHVAERMGLGVGMGVFAAQVIITIWNFFAYKHWVYVDRGHPLPADEDTVAWHERAVHRLKVIANVGPAASTAAEADPAELPAENPVRPTPEVGAS